MQENYECLIKGKTDTGKVFMYKLIAIDLDATLLQSDHTISEKTVETLKRAKANGMRVMINTGRSYAEAKPYIEQLDFINYISMANGSLIYDRKNDDFIQIYNMDLELIKTVHEKSVKYADEITFVVTGEVDTLADKIFENSKGVAQHRDLCGEGALRLENNLMKKLEDMFIAKGLLIGDNEYLKLVKSDIENCLGDKIQLLFSLPGALEVLDPHMDKSNSLKFIMEKYRIDSSEIIAIGDGENDIGMIKSAGVGVAMQNASEKLKSVADFVTLSNNENGVAFAIEKFIFKR